MQARLYKPSKTAMSSGMARTSVWLLEYAPKSARDIDPLMGWTSSADTQTQVKLRFDTRQDALDYAQKHGIEILELPTQTRRRNIRAGGYADNFATNRREVWTH